jgi:putative nucleotidyltransferase with HDIG domain
MRRRTVRVAAELVRPLPRPGAQKDYVDRPYERALLAALFAVGGVAVAYEPSSGAAHLLGLTAVIGGLVFLGGRFLVRFEREAIASLRTVAVLGFMALLLLGLARVARDTPHFTLLLLPLPTFALLLALLISPRFAAAFAIFVSVLVAVVAWGTRDLLSSLLVLTAGALAGVLYSFRVRRPSRLLAIGLIVAVVQSLVVASAGALRGEIARGGPIEPLLDRLLVAAGHGLATGLLVLGLLPLFERLFARISDLTLLEYSNQNEQPALRRLQVEAPGTHHHSFMVGTLAEAAAEAIDANGLLCRVGAYFHDIGKMNKPEYFSENSTDARARHGALSPEMSKLIITAHPKDGIELAEHYRIPKPIQAFIEEHHGTTAVEYFWRLAVAQRNEEEVPKEDYRYAGPRPKTKETAIVMIADSVEAASRTLKDVTPGRLEQLVDDLVRMKMDDRQLDDCSLTMRELTRIKEAFLQVLVGVHHRRPAYPRDPTGRLSVPLAELEGELVPEIESGRAPEPRSADASPGREPGETELPPRRPAAEA